MSRTIFLISLLFFSSSLFAQQPTTPKANITQSVTHSALLRAEGKSIRVNGVAVPSSMTIFSEDRIDTGADTAAIVIMGGRILTLDRNSSAVFRNGTLVLNQGKAWLANQNGSTPGTVTRLAAARVRGPSSTPLAADEKSGKGDEGSTNDHFTGTCKQFPKACDQAEDACEKKNHRECACTYNAIMIRTTSARFAPDSDDFQCQPVGGRCRNDDCGN
jgi:hypothetical protein